MNKINVNGKTYPLTVDSFGITYVQGKTVDAFMDNLSTEDMLWLAKYGMKVVTDEPEHYEDIAERVEMPRDEKETLNKFKGEV